MSKRTLTVYAGSGKGCSYISQIILQGKWLETLGFSIGDKVTVDCQPGRVEAFERGGVNILQILLPPYNPNISDILRVYILFMERGDGRGTKRYFVVKRFKDGNVSILYVNAEMEVLLGEDLTGHIGDMEYEYHKLVSDYAKILVLELGIK